MVEPNPVLRVIGIDPGTRVVGWGVVEAHGGRYRAVDHGALKSNPRHDVPTRLAALVAALREVLVAYAPGEAAIEEAFHGRDATAALRIGEARGALVVALAEHRLSVCGYTNNVIKKAVTGAGRASKQQVQAMVRRVLAMAEPPTPFDAADALAVAVCHLQRRGTAAGGAPGISPRLRESLRRAGVDPRKLDPRR